MTVQLHGIRLDKPVNMEDTVDKPILPLLLLFSSESFEVDRLGQEKLKSNPNIEHAIFEGDKFVLAFTSNDEAARHIELHRLIRKLRAASINTPYEFVSIFGQLASDGFTGIITDFTNRNGRGVYKLQPVLEQMRAIVAADVRREQD